MGAVVVHKTQTQIVLYLRIDLSNKGLEGACFAVYQEISFTWLR